MAIAGRRSTVLLVEDHPALQRFVQLALEPLELQLHAVASVAAAHQWMAAHATPDLLLTDLMLPDGSGIELIRVLRDEGLDARRLPVVVMTASAPAAQQGLLAALEVEQVLVKPVPLPELLRCVESALSRPRPTLATAAAAPAVDQHFGGDRALFDLFHASFMQQLPIDLQSGDAATAQANWPGLRLVAHNLKSVLRMLGEDAAAELALQIENAAAVQDAGACARGWPQLRAQLQGLLRRHGAHSVGDT